MHRLCKNTMHKSCFFILNHCVLPEFIHIVVLKKQHLFSEGVVFLLSDVFLLSVVFLMRVNFFSPNLLLKKDIFLLSFIVFLIFLSKLVLELVSPCISESIKPDSRILSKHKLRTTHSQQSTFNNCDAAHCQRPPGM